MERFEPDYGLIHDLLADVDLVAAANVASGRGGPFSATILLMVKTEAGTYRDAYALTPTGNAVLKTGRASAHAEDQSMTMQAVREIEEEILRLRDAGRGKDLRLVFLSSAQPCMACFTKIEIFARDLVRRSLLEPRHFQLIYGAPFAETEEVAGFNDYSYALDFLRAARNRRNPSLLVPIEQVHGEEIPEFVRAVLFAARAPTAVLVKGGEILAVGRDQRKTAGLFATAECSAIHAASRQLMQKGEITPWDLRGATLYTRTLDIGPLIYAEAQWAGVGKIVTVAAPYNGVTYDQTLESPDVRNGFLFGTIAAGYNNPKSAVSVFHDDGYLNVAQEAWWIKDDRQMYNGTSADSAFGSEDRIAFDRRFAPFELEGAGIVAAEIQLELTF